MKKILFNDKYNLTQAVLEGRKTQTRRVITYPKIFHGIDVYGYYVCRRATDGTITELCMYDEDESLIDQGQILPKYKVGEVVAVAQSYKDVDAFYSAAFSRKHSVHGMTIDILDCVSDEDIKKWFDIREQFVKKASWNNKMFVKPEYMLHQIYVSNVRTELLQEISEEECLKEGIGKYYIGFGTDMVDDMGFTYSFDGKNGFPNAREAYASLIDKISGKGTWENNPYVFVYDFELVK